MFLADDNVIVREGVRAMLAAQPDLEVVGVGRGLRRAGRRRRGGGPAGGRHRHPHAAALPARGHRRAQGDPQAPPRHRRRDPQPVRRPRVRDLAAGRGRGRLRLPAEGPHRRGRPAGSGDPRGRDRRLGARPGDRRARWSARCAARAASTPRTTSCSRWSPRASRSRRSPRRRNTTPAAVDDARRAPVPATSPRASRAGTAGALRRLRMLHQAIVDREEQGETLSPAAARRAWPRSCARDGAHDRRDRAARRSRC